MTDYPDGFDVQWSGKLSVTPKSPLAGPPFRWTIGPVITKTTEAVAGTGPGRVPTPQERAITVQLLATQQVDLSITGVDKYGNPTPVTGDTFWTSSDEAIITLDVHDESHVTAVTTGEVGSAAITVTNDVNADGTGDFIGSLAIDVVAGPMAEIEVVAGEPTDKPA